MITVGQPLGVSGCVVCVCESTFCIPTLVLVIQVSTWIKIHRAVRFPVFSPHLPKRERKINEVHCRVSCSGSRCPSWAWPQVAFLLEPRPGSGFLAPRHSLAFSFLVVDWSWRQHHWAEV